MLDRPSLLSLSRPALLAAGMLALVPLASARRPPEPQPADVVAPAEPTGIEALLTAADDIARQVVALRGLETRRPIARGVMSRDEIGKKLEERIGKEYTPEEIRVESRLLKRLGLLPPDIDYQQLLIGLLEEQVAGFYDPFARQLYIADWLGLELQRPAMAHEIEHALQDQHFDLKSFATPIKDDGDRQLAHQALVEGDATAVMLEFVAQSHGFDVGNLPDNVISAVGREISSGAMDQSPIYSHAPRFLRETLLFPYYGGMQFVYALRRGHPWSRVDEVWKSPPESTEQVMHPEKYLAKEHPVAITAAPLTTLAPRTELRSDVLGEFEMRVLFLNKLDDGDADRAAAGWGGDRLAVYGEPDAAKPVVVIDRSTWDSEEDARQAELAFQKVLARDGVRPVSAAGVTWSERDSEAFAVERRGRELVALFGVPAESRVAVADEVWRTWKAAERKSEKPARGDHPHAHPDKAQERPAVE